MKPFYAVKHWLLTLAIAPLPLIFYSLFVDHKDLSASLVYIPLVFTYSLLFSLPVFVLYFIVCSMIKTIQSPILTKVLLNTMVVAGIIATLFIIGGSAKFNILFYYSTMVFVCSLFLKIKKNDAEQGESEYSINMNTSDDIH